MNGDYVPVWNSVAKANLVAKANCNRIASHCNRYELIAGPENRELMGSYMLLSQMREGGWEEDQDEMEVMPNEGHKFWSGKKVGQALL